ncbi:MAG: sulfite exporter TauE/SafE family protein [Candidatus Hermodarchaeota archaeon]
MVENLLFQLLIGGLILIFAALAGTVGIGGGGLFTPILLMIGGLTISQAIPVASAAIFGVGLGSTLVNIEHHTINYQLALTLEPFTIIGTFIGVQIFLNIPEYLILFFFTILMIVLSLKTIKRAQKIKNELKTEERETDSNVNSQLSPNNTLIAIGGSFSAGMMSSIVGIGGGLIKVPMLNELGLSPEIAFGTGSFMVLFTALSTSAQFIMFNQLELVTGIIVFALGFIGSILGAFLSRNDPHPYFLQLLLAFMIILSTIFLIGESILYSRML